MRRGLEPAQGSDEVPGIIGAISTDRDPVPGPAGPRSADWPPCVLIALEGLKGRPIGELCAEHGIGQAQYYQWRDQFLANAARAFEPAGAPSRQCRLECENARLKTLVGELALELNKTEEILG